MMEKRCLLFCLVVCLLSDVFAQNLEENQRKYDGFRSRFHRDFVYAPGDASFKGAYIPMELRTTKKDGRTVGYWADGTWWLGHYVAVLALEYKCLQLENKPAHTTLQELKQALKTYLRLDRTAELCWQSDTCTNGFYIRDDVGADMAAVFNTDAVSSDYSGKCGVEGTLSNSPSQDQAWASYMGLALAKRLVDDDEVQSLVKTVALMFSKSMHFVDGKKEVWEVVNPVTGMVAQKRADIQWLRYAHASAYEVLTDDTMTFGRAHKPFWKSSWNFLQNNFMIDKRGHFNWYGVMVLSTVINDRGRGEKNVYDWLVKCSRKLADKRPDLGQPLMFPHLSLVAMILHGYDGTQALPAEVYEEILNVAPADGAALLRSADTLVRTPAPWNSMSLFCPWHTSDVGRYNMLDYMLLFNAYKLIYKDAFLSADER